jgi:hypothetical protein
LRNKRKDKKQECTNDVDRFHETTLFRLCLTFLSLTTLIFDVLGVRLFA